ncbi:MAG: hypothetical protein LBH00_01225 [Planctomycetaceae bacterium]|jgi:hypothetical protein|nr:hypothetical protein [Planctomycetaceae bacterium]
MKYHAVFVQRALLLMLFGVSAFAEEGVFVPTETQRMLLKEGAEYAKKLEERYSNLTMLGTTEFFDSDKPEEQRHPERFRFVRIGHQYCLVESQVTVPGAGRGKPKVLRMCYLVNPRAYYRFMSQDRNNPSLALAEKIEIENHDRLAGMIDYHVNVNWQTGAAPYCVAVDLSCPFDISAARAASPKQGGYIKGITEEIVDGKRVVALAMGYYYGNTESNGRVSFYPDYYWAVKDAMIEGIKSTGEIYAVFKTSNIYDFSDTFPKLTKTTIETWDADGKKLQQSEISTITSIDFTVPDVSVFDAKQFLSSKKKKRGYSLLSKRVSIFRRKCSKINKGVMSFCFAAANNRTAVSLIG